MGGVEAFKYFLSTGLDSSGKEEMVEEVKRLGMKEMAEYFLKGEGYKKSPDLVGKFLEDLAVDGGSIEARRLQAPQGFS